MPPTPPTPPTAVDASDPDAEWLQQQGNLRSIASEATRKAWGPSMPLDPERNWSQRKDAEARLSRSFRYPAKPPRLENLIPEGSPILSQLAAEPIRGSSYRVSIYSDPALGEDTRRLKAYRTTSLPSDATLGVARRMAEMDSRYAPWLQQVVDWFEKPHVSPDGLSTWYLNADINRPQLAQMIRAAQENDSVGFLEAFHAINARVDRANGQYDTTRYAPLIQEWMPAATGKRRMANVPTFDAPPWYDAVKLATGRKDPRINPTPVAIKDLPPLPITRAMPSATPPAASGAPASPAIGRQLPAVYREGLADPFVAPVRMPQPSIRPMWAAAADRLGATADSVIEAVNPQIQPTIAVPGWVAALQLGAARDTADTAYPLAMPILAPHQVYSINPERD